MKTTCFATVAALVAIMAAPAFAVEVKPPRKPAPEIASVMQTEYDALLKRYQALMTRRGAHASACPKVVSTADKKASCDAEAAAIDSEAAVYAAAYEDNVRNQEILLLGAVSNFGSKDVERLARGLKEIYYRTDAAGRRTEIVRGSNAQVISTWNVIENRVGRPDLVAAAAAGQGPAIHWAGMQSHQDCALFALANASDRPYSRVAAVAGEMIGQAPWRSQAERDQINTTMKTTGFQPHEILLLAEGFGEGHVVQNSAFAATIRGGQAIHLGIAMPLDPDPTGRIAIGGHAIVLSRVFEYAEPGSTRQTWYEIVNSNLEFPTERHYATAAELDVLARRNGIVYRPNPGTVTPLLRPREGQ